MLENVSLLSPFNVLQVEFAERVIVMTRIKEAHTDQGVQMDVLSASLQSRAFAGEI